MMIQHGLVFGGWFVFFLTVEHLGERSLATTNIVRNISSFLFMFVQAFASVNSSLVSNLIGEIKSAVLKNRYAQMPRVTLIWYIACDCSYITNIYNQ